MRSEATPIPVTSVRPASFTDKIAISECPVCGHRGFRPVRDIAGTPVVACAQCGLQFANPQPSDEELSRLYGPGYFLQPDQNFTADDVARMKQATANLYLDQLATAGLAAGGRLLEVGSGHGDLLVAASQLGYQVTGVEYSAHACEIIRSKLGTAARIVQGEIANLDPTLTHFDAAIACDVIEHVRRPREFLREVRTRLAPGGLILLATPSLDSWSARVLATRWMEYKAEHLTYFSERTLRQLLEEEGFANVLRHAGRKRLSFDYVAAHFERYPVRGVSPLVRIAHRLAPSWLTSRLFSVVASGMVLIGRNDASKPVR